MDVQQMLIAALVALSGAIGVLWRAHVKSMQNQIEFLKEENAALRRGYNRNGQERNQKQ